MKQYIGNCSDVIDWNAVVDSVANSKPVQEYNWQPMRDGGPKSKEFQEYMRTVNKRVHPEMKDVEPGTELMGVNFKPKTECDLEEYRDLQNRIEELKSELEDPWEDEDEDGGLVVRR